MNSHHSIAKTKNNSRNVLEALISHHKCWKSKKWKKANNLKAVCSSVRHRHSQKPADNNTSTAGYIYFRLIWKTIRLVRGFIFTAGKAITYARNGDTCTLVLPPLPSPSSLPSSFPPCPSPRLHLHRYYIGASISSITQVPLSYIRCL